LNETIWHTYPLIGLCDFPSYRLKMIFKHRSSASRRAHASSTESMPGESLLTPLFSPPVDRFSMQAYRHTGLNDSEV
jgi:hypothetical protein